MEKLMPIEPGCLCLCFDPDLRDGPQQVEIVRLARDGEEHPGHPGVFADGDLWEFTPALPMLGGYEPLIRAPESVLLRIDGYQAATKEKEKERVEG